MMHGLAFAWPELALPLGLMAILVALGVAEGRRPLRAGHGLDARRWFANIALAVAGVAAVETLLPDMPTGGDATLAGVVAGVLALDLLRYAIHRAVHAVPALWRLHAVHHSDPQLDLTTAFRHHPAESLLIGAVVVATMTLGVVPPSALACYGALALLLAPIQHGNWRLPAGLDPALRLVVVTPELHALHHSTELQQSNTNFGVVFSFWDRLFGTHRAPEPVDAFGLAERRDDDPASLLDLLVAPLRR